MANDTHQSTQGIALATLSFMTLLLTIPPMIWHLRNSNLAAGLLIVWLCLLLLINFVNAILWPYDSWDTIWYNGLGLCDVEVKIQVAAQVALPSCLACVLRRLAKVLDVEKQTIGESKGQKRKALLIDLLWCIGFPVLQMLFHLIVQSYRYMIFNTYGCVPYTGGSWVSFVLMIVPPAIWVGVDVYFAVLIIIRLYRYRVSFSSILASNNTTRSRFLRLYLLCLIFIVVSVPLEIYILYQNVDQKWHAFSWSQLHSSKYWHSIIELRTEGKVLYDRWVWLTFGILVFVFFGFGKDAVEMHRKMLLAIKLDKVFPKLNPNNRVSESSTRRSFGDKARRLLKRVSSSSMASTAQTSELPKTLSSSA